MGYLLPGIEKRLTVLHHIRDIEDEFSLLSYAGNIERKGYFPTLLRSDIEVGDNSLLHLLTIYAILADGSKWYYTNDVTDQMHDSSSSTPTDDNHIYIELDDLPVPKPIVNGSGFQPTIDGWQGVEIEVGM